MRRDATGWRRRLRWAIEAGVASAVEAMARLVPAHAVPRVGAAIGAVAHGVDARHRRIARQNVRRAYGSAMSDEAQRALVRRCFAHFGRVAVEILRFSGLSADAVGRAGIPEGLEHLLAACGRGRGVIVCAAHFGNWELHALLQGWAGVPIRLVTRPLDNPRLERRITRLRGRSGNSVVDKRQSLAPVVEALRRGETVGILVDQRPHSGVSVPFFGRPALTSTAPALLALRTGAAIVPAYSVPNADGSYRLVYEPEMPVTRSGDIGADVERLTAACTARVERWVREHPDIWLWMHDRWRDGSST